MSETDRHWGLILAGIAAFGFSFKAILIKLAYPYGIDAVTLLALRMSFALPIFLYVGLAASMKLSPLMARDWGMVVVLGLFGYYGASILDFFGLVLFGGKEEFLLC